MRRLFGIGKKEDEKPAAPTPTLDEGIKMVQQLHTAYRKR